MKFKETDIDLMIDGMGIVFYSPETNKNIPEGCNGKYTGPLYCARKDA